MRARAEARAVRYNARTQRRLSRVERHRRDSRARRDAMKRTVDGLINVAFGPGFSMTLEGSVHTPQHDGCDEAVLDAVVGHLSYTHDAEMRRGLIDILAEAGCADRVEFISAPEPEEMHDCDDEPTTAVYDIIDEEPEVIVEAPAPEVIVEVAAHDEEPVVATIADDGDRGSSAVNGDFEAVEWAIVELINSVRAERGLTKLIYEARLQAAAIGHSVEMYKMEYFSHTSPLAEHGEFAARINQEGITDFGVAGENLVMGPDARDLAERFVDIWMDSPGHRANVLGEDFRFTGVGVYGLGDRVYATQLFTQRVERAAY